MAAIEIVSPSNKDRAESRGAFVSKVSTLLKQDVCVSIIDVVSTKYLNLYADLLTFIDGVDPCLGAMPDPMYAFANRVRDEKHRRLLDSWFYPLEIGQPLLTLPIWLSENVAVPLDLDACYEATCRMLRIR